MFCKFGRFSIKTFSIIISTAFFLHLGQCKSTYSAAVVEYNPIKFSGKLTILEIVERNVQEYLKILDQIQRPLDIIVFPECTLDFGSNSTSREELVSATAVVTIGKIPCKSKDEEIWFFRLSCAAVSHKTYLSVDIVERSLCEGRNCASDNWNLYNTNVVFDRDGRIVAKYRKFNLFREKNMNVTETAMLSKFTTDFGVEFGMFVCFDIVYEYPPLKLIQEGVKHFIFPTMWHSHLPFFTALQVQQMFAYGNDVVLLAAGANIPRNKKGGSSIVQGKLGTLASYMNATAGTKVLISEVKKTWNAKDFHKLNKKPNKFGIVEDFEEVVDGFNLEVEKLTNYTFLSYDSRIETYTIKLENVRCDFNITSRQLSNSTNKISYTYYLIGYSGAKALDGVAEGEVQVCALVACYGKTKETCAKRISSENVNYQFEFQTVSVRTTVEAPENSIQYPNSVTNSLRPLGVEEFAWKEEIISGKKIRENLLLRPRKNLLTFGIFGREFS